MTFLTIWCYLELQLTHTLPQRKVRLQVSGSRAVLVFPAGVWRVSERPLAICCWPVRLARASVASCWFDEYCIDCSYFGASYSGATVSLVGALKCDKGVFEGAGCIERSWRF